MNLETFLRNRLLEGGWILDRQTGKHQVWRHPNGSAYMPPERMSDTGKRRINCLKAIARLEKA